MYAEKRYLVEMRGHHCICWHCIDNYIHL